MAFNFSIGASYGYGGYGYYGYNPYSWSNYLQTISDAIEVDAHYGRYGCYSPYRVGAGFGLGFGIGGYCPASFFSGPCCWDFPVWTSYYSDPFDHYFLPEISSYFYSASSLPGSYSSYSSGTYIVA